MGLNRLQVGQWSRAPGQVNNSRLQYASPLTSITAGKNEMLPGGIPGTERVPGLTSIIIMAHNRLELTRKCVESVLTHTSTAFELMLVDNGSTDGVAELFSHVARKFPLVKVVRKERNHGVYARTYGMQLARGEFIAWLDNDVEVGPGWLGPLLGAMSDPQVGGAGREGVGFTPDWQHRFHTEGWPSEQAAGQDADVLVGYCCLFRNLTHYIGFLDPSFNPFWNEEADYCLRIKLLGYKLKVVPTNVIHHRHGTGLALLKNRDEHINRMNHLLIQKWEPFKHLVLEVFRNG